MSKSIIVPQGKLYTGLRVRLSLFGGVCITQQGDGESLLVDRENIKPLIEALDEIYKHLERK